MFQAIAARLLIVFGLIATATATARGASFVAVDVRVNDLAYSPLSGMVYGAIGNSAVVNPNTILPIDPTTGTPSTAIPIGFDPQRVAVSYDGTNVFTIMGGWRAVQRYNVPTATADQLFTINGGPQFNAVYAIPDRPNAVLMHSFTPGQSPPDGVNAVYENGVRLNDRWLGPDIVAVDPTDGTRGFGYVNSNTSFGSGLAAIDASGIHGVSGSQLNGVLTSFGINRLGLVGDRVFTNLGGIYSVSLGIQVGAFEGGGTFVIDPSVDRFFTITSSGSTHTIHAYSLTTLAPLGTDTLTGINGGVFSLTRFGDNGLAFATTAGQVIFVNSQLVPEPATLGLAAGGALAIAVVGLRGRRKRQAARR